MYYSGYIIDATTKMPLAGATVIPGDSAYTDPNHGTTANSVGFWELDSGVFASSPRIQVSYVGYSTINFPIDYDGQVFELTPETPSNLPGVTVTAHKKDNTLLYVGLGAAALLAIGLLAGKKKSGAKVGAAEEGHSGLDWTRILIWGGVIAGGYFLLIKPLLNSLGLLKPLDNLNKQAVLDAQQKSLDQAVQDAQAQGKRGQTFPDDTYVGWANTVYTAITSSPPDQSTIVETVVQVNTDVDLQKLIGAFGVKRAGGFMCSNFNLYCQDYDLPSFLHQVLDAAHIGNINQYLSDQGINYSF